jgi:hypothetical protein
MSGLYDRLTDRRGGDPDPGGISMMDIASLPTAQRQVMLAVLRDTNAAATGITSQALAETLGWTDALAAILADLVAHGWLLALGDASARRYKVNFAPRRRQSGFGMWSSLGSSRSDDGQA